MSLPYFPLFPADFEAKTSHLTIAEDGAYNRLLRICWMTPGCTMPADEAWIMRRARARDDAEVEAVRAVLAEFFTVENGRYSNAKLMRVWIEANEAHEKRKNAGSKGGKAKALKTNNSGSSSAVAMPKQPEPEPEPVKRDTSVSLSKRAKPERFQEFWDQYPHRGGAKKARADCEKRYARHVAAGVPEQTIISAAIRYASDRQVLEGYAKNPATWLNKKGWEDEIEPVGPNPRNTGRSGPHDSLMAGFAAFANSDPGSGETGFGGGGSSDGSGWSDVDRGPGGNASQPILRVIGSN